MTPNLQAGDRVDVIGGDFTNFKNGLVIALDGEFAQVEFEIFGRVAGPVRNPVKYLRKYEQPSRYVSSLPSWILATI